MSLFESGNSSGAAKLSDIFDSGKTKTIRSDIDYRKLIDLICRGGWPGVLGLDDKTAIRTPYQYIKSIIDMDMSRIDGKRRSRTTVETVLRSLARNNATLAGNSKLIEDIHSSGITISEPTLRSYLDVLKKLYIIEEQNAWHPSLRSRARIRTTPKRHFTDPSLAAAALEARPDILYKDPATAGFLFESLCYRDVSVYASALGGRVFHYRDSSGLEVDQIIQLDDGRWGAAEVKIGASEFDRAAANLIRLKEKMIKANVREPSFLMILNVTGVAAHTRPDGVVVMPIDCLGP
jgi:predicted AAA+ superfamily ATPase